MVRLGDVCEILNGYAFKSNQYVDNGIRIIRIANVQKGYIEDSSPVFYPSESTEAQKYMLSNNDLLISLTGNVGRVALIDKSFLPATLNQRVACLRIKDETVLKKSFLFHFLNSDNFEEMCIASSKGIAQKNMSTEWLKEYEIPLFSIKEQLRIATVLDKLSNLISQRKQQFTKLDELVKARFVEMFGDPVQNEKNWKLSSLDSICSSIVDCPHSTPSYTTENTGYMCIRTSIVKKNQILWDRIEYIPENEYYQRIQRKRPKKGDIIYTREGAILGIAAMIDQDCNVALGQRLMLLSPNSAYCCSCFLSVAMNFDSFLNKALKGLGGSASPHINVGDIKSFQIITPPIELQKEFTKFAENSNNQRLTIQKSLYKLEVLKKSLMQKYFG